jgi:hypothetical protein
LVLVFCSLVLRSFDEAVKLDDAAFEEDVKQESDAEKKHADAEAGLIHLHNS